MNAIPVFEESVSDSEVLCVCIIHADIMKYRKQRKYYYQSHNVCMLSISLSKQSAHCNIVILQLLLKRKYNLLKLIEYWISYAPHHVWWLVVGRRFDSSVHFLMLL